MLTLEDLFDFILPGSASRPIPPRWPPDAFALVATALERADAYSIVVNHGWPPRGARNWVKNIRRTGRRWRQAATNDRAPLPAELVGWWKTLLKKSGKTGKTLRLEDIRADRACRNALLQICAAADEASEGLWISVPSKDEFLWKGLMHQFTDRSSCCIEVDPARAVVFPKVHTPQTGIALRSLTQNLALCSGNQVKLSWLPFSPSSFELAEHESSKQDLTLLLLPWPETIRKEMFVRAAGPLRNLGKRHAFFDCDGPRSTRAAVARIKALCVKAAADKDIGKIDAIVFPEASLRPDQARNLSKKLKKIVVAGLLGKSGKGGRRVVMNEAGVFIPLLGMPGEVMNWRQAKHHRWKLDKTQIAQYGIGDRLDDTKQWWENIAIRKRELGFFPLMKGYLMCVLICEDLARQDPVSSVVRSVGPDLVITLLMDGPQLKTRWPARYASVLADDPGSSVLTLTSLGMAERSRHPNFPVSRVIALWKGGQGDPIQEIALDHGASAVALKLKRKNTEEWTADGRRDNGGPSCLKFLLAKSI